MKPADLETLVERARRGDTEAVAALYRLHAPAIFRYIAYRVPTEEDAEDLTAEVFVRMVEGLPSYRSAGVPFEAWLYRIAAARVADFYRRAGRHGQTELFESLPDEAPLPEERLEERHEIAALKRALERLPEEQQTILLLRFVERKSHREVAAILGKSENAIKTLQYRALNRLAGLLGLAHKERHYLRGDDDDPSL